MRFKRIGFLKYMGERGSQAKYDICSSGVAAVKPDEFGLQWEDITLDGSNPVDGADIHKVIAERFGVSPDMVFVSAGSTILSFQTIAAIFEQPGAAIIEKPIYTPLEAALEVFSHDIRSLPRWFEDGWALDLEELGRIWDPSVRLIVLCNLNNPTGIRATDEEIKAIAKVAARSGGYVLVDEVFRSFDFDSPPGCAASLAPNVITTASYTKVFGLGGIRFGWFIGPPDLKERVALLNEYFAVSGHCPSLNIALRAFKNIDMLIARTRKIIDAGRPLFEEWIASRDDLECIMPDAGPIAFPRLKDGGDMTEIADRLFNEEKVHIAPGIHFGDPSGFRISFGVPVENIEHGYKALGRILDERRKSG